MTIRSTPPISLRDIVAEFGGAIQLGLKAYYRGGQFVPASQTKIPASGRISLFDFLGASKSQPGSIEFTEPGQHQWTVPDYTTMTVEVRGAGGGAGSSIWENYGAPIAASGQAGLPGGESRFLSLVAAGGAGGGAGIGTGPRSASPGVAGAAGVANSGSTNTPGGGAAGGIGKPYLTGAGPGGNGGAGGFASGPLVKGQPGAPVPGTVVTIPVGAGGAPGAFPGNQGTAGSHGSVKLTWV